MQELTAAEIDEVSGGMKPSVGMGMVGGALWIGAEMTVAVPSVAAFLGLGAAVVSGGALLANYFGY